MVARPHPYEQNESFREPAIFIYIILIVNKYACMYVCAQNLAVKDEKAYLVRKCYRFDVYKSGCSYTFSEQTTKHLIVSVSAKHFSGALRIR